ncbi:hypothetical protein KKA09_01870 [Patescibacteria group bacterium]|nr:hypothetical protein [Patescibacteria group bacterium]
MGQEVQMSKPSTINHYQLSTSKHMLSNLKQFFKSEFNNILLCLIITLLVLLSFGVGMIVQHNLEKPALEIKNSL